MGYLIPLGPGEQLCEPDELVPGDTGALRLSASSGAAPGPRLTASIGNGSRNIAVGGIPAGWRTGAITIPLSRVRSTQGATVCLRNGGSRSIALGGSVPDANFYVAIGDRSFNGRMRIEYMRPGSESWFALVPTLLHRFSLAKADWVRHWAGPAVIVLMLLAVGLAVRTVVREEPRP